MADDSGPEIFEDELFYEHGGLPKTINWWGAFVIGLAGTILVTGIAPVMVTSLGAASVPIILVITLSGWLLCLFLAELSAMMPARERGSAGPPYPAYQDRWPGVGRPTPIPPTRTAGPDSPSTSTASRHARTGSDGPKSRR